MKGDLVLRAEVFVVFEVFDIEVSLYLLKLLLFGRTLL